MKREPHSRELVQDDPQGPDVCTLGVRLRADQLRSEVGRGAAEGLHEHGLVRSRARHAEVADLGNEVPERHTAVCGGVAGGVLRSAMRAPLL
eukprot:scaffold30993_cov242-Isochrysis_galbana.AAC.2